MSPQSGSGRAPLPCRESAQRRIRSRERLPRSPTRASSSAWSPHFLLSTFDFSLSTFHSLQPQLRGPRTPLHDAEITLHTFGANLVRMPAVAASRKHPVLVDRVIELGMVR